MRTLQDTGLGARRRTALIGCELSRCTIDMAAFRETKYVPMEYSAHVYHGLVRLCQRDELRQSGPERQREATASSTRLSHHCSCGPVKLGRTEYHPGDHSPPRPDQPWSSPPPIPTAMTDVSKSMTRDQQLAATLAAIEDTGPTDIQVYTDGSTHEGNTDGGAGMVAVSGEDIIERWHAPTSRWSSSYQAEKSAMVRTISWLDEYEDWQSALVLAGSATASPWSKPLRTLTNPMATCIEYSQQSPSSARGM